MGQFIAKLRKASRTPQAILSNVDKVLERKSIAPRHPTTVKAFDELVKANPQFKIASEIKNEELHKRLKTVRVESDGAAPDKILKSSKKKLETSMDGRLTYDQIEELFINCKLSPEIWSDEKISKNYKLDVKVAKNLLNHFSSFYIYKEEEVDTDVPATPFFQREQEKPKFPEMK